jgi:hypothetical protein
METPTSGEEEWMGSGIVEARMTQEAGGESDVEVPVTMVDPVLITMFLAPEC